MGVFPCSLTLAQTGLRVIEVLAPEDREAILRVLGSALHEAEHAGYKEMTPEEITQVESVKGEMPPFSETSIAFLRGCLDSTFLFDRDFDGWFRLAVEPPSDSHPKKN